MIEQVTEWPLSGTGNPAQDPFMSWVLLVAPGEYGNDDFDLIFDSKAFQSIVTNFENGLKLFPAGVLVDYDYFTDDLKQASRAAGWITALKSGLEGLWARVTWTPIAFNQITGREYIYVAPQWDGAAQERVSGKILRPLRLLRASLTNRPTLNPSFPVFPIKQTEPGTNEPLTTGNNMRNATRAQQQSQYDQAAADQFKALADQIKINNRCSFDQAWDMAQTQNPALFQKMNNRKNVDNGAIADSNGFKKPDGIVEAMTPMANQFFDLVIAKRAKLGLQAAWQEVSAEKPEWLKAFMSVMER